MINRQLEQSCLLAWWNKQAFISFLKARMEVLITDLGSAIPEDGTVIEKLQTKKRFQVGN